MMGIIKSPARRRSRRSMAALDSQPCSASMTASGGCVFCSAPRPGEGPPPAGSVGGGNAASLSASQFIAAPGRSGIEEACLLAASAMTVTVSAMVKCPSHVPTPTFVGVRGVSIRDCNAPEPGAQACELLESCSNTQLTDDGQQRPEPGVVRRLSVGADARAPRLCRLLQGVLKLHSMKADLAS
jgi:hypothetical protein